MYDLPIQETYHELLSHNMLASFKRMRKIWFFCDGFRGQSLFPHIQKFSFRMYEGGGGGVSGYFCYYYGVMLRISIDLHISLDITSSITFKFKFAFWVIEPWKSPAFDIKYSSSASSEPKKSWNAKERKWMNHFITLRERLFYFQFQFLKKCRGRWRTISIAEERIGAWRHWA